MRIPTLADSSAIKKLGAMTLMSLALAACGGGGGSDTAANGGGGQPAANEGEEKGCFAECKKFMAKLVDDFAGGAAAKTAKAAGDGLAVIVEGDKVTFSVASVAMQGDRSPGPLVQAFPVSGSTLAYSLTIDKASGVITVDNKNGTTFSAKAYEEATYFQEIDYGKTDLADKNKSHYAYIAFNAKEKANSIGAGKDANLRRQWKQASGETYPSPGVSILMHTHYESCPDKQDICDIVMLTANPEMHAPANGGNGPTPNSAQISATVAGAQQLADVNVQGSWIINGSAGNSLSAQSSAQPPIVWSIQHLKAAVGTYSCGTSGEMGDIAFTNPGIVAGDPMSAITNAWKIQTTTAHRSDGGKCMVTVTKVDESVIEGTFTATLVAKGTGSQLETYAVTNGSFSVPKK